MNFRNAGVRRCSRSIVRTLNAMTCVAAFALLGLASGRVHADEGETFPAYRSELQVDGTIRMWGHGSLEKDYIGGLVKSWEAGFRQFHPKVRFETTLRGDLTAIGGLYTGAADMALMERAPTAIELDAYQPIFKRDPFEISIATGSLDVADHAAALVIFVNRDNPLRRLTLTQLDAVFDADHRRGPNSVRTWGELGLSGEWARHPINAYIPAIESDTSQYFEKAVMGGSQKWSANLHEFRDIRKPGSDAIGSGQQIADALAKDRYGIAIATLPLKNPRVRPLALAQHDGGVYYEPTRESVAQRRYPLTRTVSIFINRTEGQSIEPNLKEYLHYLLSGSGQLAITRDGGYFALPPEIALQEWSKLK